MPKVPLNHSKTQVRRAGDVLRAWWAHGTDSDQLTLLGDVWRPTREEVDRAYAVMDNYRAAHSYPLTKARMGLQSMCRTAGVQAEISQRLKRQKKILEKLQRHPHMSLSAMQDIAGCRAVLADVAALRAVQDRLRATERFVRDPDDYIERPKESGYRGVHVIVEYDERPVEIQLRTQLQHQWAYTVEKVGGTLRVDLKSGIGPPEVLRYFELVSQALHNEEAGHAVPEYLAASIERARPAVEEAVRRART